MDCIFPYSDGLIGTVGREVGAGYHFDPAVVEWTPDEPGQVIHIFADMLWAATNDGAAKRKAGNKPSWKVDQSHEAALFSHLSKWKHRELVDADSNAHPLVHAAWRCLAIAYQESR